MIKKLQIAMFAVTGLLPAAASADIRAPKTTKVAVSPINDTAPVTGTTPPRLRRTDEEQAGFEMSKTGMFGDGKSGLYFAMATELNGVRANNKMQLAVIPFHLAQEADGSVAAVVDMTGARFATNNNGNETRNANHPSAFTAFDGNTVCAEYNYQPNNSNDTKRYLQCFDKAGATVLPQTQIYAKNNDDASMNQDKNSTWVVSSTATSMKLVAWRGANGNGADDGWAQTYTLTKDAAGKIAFKQIADVSLCPREERSHGMCSTSAADPNTAFCTWTEGNTQPQRDGTWIAAVDITPGKFSGADRQQSILWKEQVDGRKDIDGLRTYSMRASHERILKPDASGNLVPSSELLWYSNDLRGNNNENRKGGTVYRINMAVIKADKTGMSFTQPLTDMSAGLRGLGGTHLGMTLGMFGAADSMKPGVMFLNGSHTGGYFAGQARTMTFDAATASFKDGGMTATAPNDRHLYPNYLGNNPGNQGRNYSHSMMVANPFVGVNGNTDKFLMMHATTGKPMEEVGMPEYKATAFMTITPVASACNADGTGSTPGCQNQTDPSTDPQDPTDPVDPTTPGGEDPTAADPGASLGGCSSTGGSAGLASMLLIGLAAFIRRRRA